MAANSQYAGDVANVVVISPHLDDAVFSCWHVIGDAQHNVSVVTVFTAAKRRKRGSWDACIDRRVNSEDRARERQAEDRVALSVAARVPVHLPLYDSQFGSTPLSRVVDALAQHVQSADAVYAPLAIWNHDHVLVREAVCRIRGRPCFYLDYPYALVYPTRPLDTVPALLDGYRSQDVVLTDDEVSRKLAACHAYSGELERLRTCADFGDFATADNLRRETVYRP